MTVGLLFLGAQLATWQQVSVGLLIAWSCGNLGGMFEVRGWVLLSELLRLALAALFAVGLAQTFGPASDGALLATTAASVIFFGASSAWLLRYKMCFRPRTERSATPELA